MPYMGRVISADDFPAVTRLASWQENVAQKLLKVEWQVPDAAAFGAKIVPVLFAGEIEIINLETGPFRITNTENHARQKTHRCAVHILTGGLRVVTEREGVAVEAHRTMGVILDEGRFYRHSSDNPTTRALILMLPKARLVERVPSFGRLIGEPLETSCKPFRVLQSYLNLFTAGVDLNTPAMSKLNGDYVLDLVTMILQERADAEDAAAKRAGPVARYKVIQSEIERGLADPKLSGKTVARRIGITERYLQQLMEANGETFSRYVLRLRLDKAAQMLTAKPDMRVAEVALLSGFSDLSYFNRSFRKRFGETPRGYRK